MQIGPDRSLLVERYGERMLLDPSGSLYWKRKRWLIISDVHFGKSAHFRKKGMAIPEVLDAVDIHSIQRLISMHKPYRVILLGDLFHSDYNAAWERLAAFTREYKKRFFTLVRGNHDVLSDWHYGRTHLEVVDDIAEGPFYFTHIPTHQDELINICGHLHPGISLSGKGRQRIRLKSFFFRSESVILPAFGSFTGCISIKPKKSDLVIGLASGELIQLHP